MGITSIGRNLFNRVVYGPKIGKTAPNGNTCRKNMFNVITGFDANNRAIRQIRHIRTSQNTTETITIDYLPDRVTKVHCAEIEKSDGKLVRGYNTFTDKNGNEVLNTWEIDQIGAFKLTKKVSDGNTTTKTERIFVQNQDIDPCRE